MIAIGTKEQIESLELSLRKSSSKKWSELWPIADKFWIRCPDGLAEELTYDGIQAADKVVYITEGHFKSLKASKQPEIAVKDESVDDVTIPEETDDFTLVTGVGKASAKKINEKGFYTFESLNSFRELQTIESMALFFDLSEEQIINLLEFGM